MPTLKEAKERLDEIINKARVDLYKPIQIAEVLNYSRINQNIDIEDPDQYRNPSLKWRNDITIRFTGKKSTSSARYQHDVWNETAMHPTILSVLDIENKRLNGVVERYIYQKYFDKLNVVSNIITYVKSSTTKTFSLTDLINLFLHTNGLKRSIDKAYEIVSYSLFETIVCALDAQVELKINRSKKHILEEFPELAQVLLGIDPNSLTFSTQAHIYRVGVTNAADRGLDMWANFGIAIQVKHLTLNSELANSIVDQVECDNIVIVCTDADATAIETITKQIGWGKRVKGIIKESDLVTWYEKCLRGKYSHELGEKLLLELVNSFEKEFPQAENNIKDEFFVEREYNLLAPNKFWDPC